MQFAACSDGIGTGGTVEVGWMEKLIKVGNGKSDLVLKVINVVLKRLPAKAWERAVVGKGLKGKIH